MRHDTQTKPTLVSLSVARDDETTTAEGPVRPNCDLTTNDTLPSAAFANPGLILSNRRVLLSLLAFVSSGAFMSRFCVSPKSFGENEKKKNEDPLREDPPCGSKGMHVEASPRPRAWDY